LIGVIVLAVIAVVVPDGRLLVQYTFGGTLAPDVSPGLQAAILIANLAILINLSLFFFNLFPIPPLDGSHIVRNMLPYNAVQVYDRVPFWLSYMLMIFAGPYVMAMLLTPALRLIYFGLSHI
jgi:Zn-dependent protease